MITIRSTSGSFEGDPNGIFADVESTITSDSVTIEGTFSYLGTVSPINGTFSLPAPSASITYVSIQSTSSGTLQLLSSTTAAPTLSSSNVIEVFALTIPANVSNDEAFSSDSEPVLD